MANNSLQITQGTNSNIAFDAVGGTAAGTNYQVVKIDMGGAAASSPFTGTLGAVTNLAGGTINNGTFVANGGTVQINNVPIQAPLTFGTLGTAGGSFFGTISGTSGAGTKHYVTGFSIVQQSGTSDVRILTGSAIQGTGVITAGFFSPSGGIARDLTTPFVTGTNSEIIYHFVGAGTAYIVVNYWKGV